MRSACAGPAPASRPGLDLSEIAAAWPTLPAAIRRAVLALVRAGGAQG